MLPASVGFRSPILLLVAMTILAGPVAALPAQETRSELPPVEIEERPELLRPARSRSEAEQDRLDAAALFAHGRLLRQQGQPDEALTRLQRAWRFNPDSLTISQEIIGLASQLNRQAEATRYAVLAAETHPSEFPMLGQLGLLAMRQGQNERAMRILENAIQLATPEQSDQEWFALHVELGRLYLLQKEPQKAAETFAKVLQGLNDPDRFTTQEQRQILQRPQLLYTLMTESFLDVGNVEQARLAIEKLDALQPDAGAVALRAARLAAAEEKWDEATTQLTKYLESDSDAGGTQPYTLLEQILQQQQENNEAAQEVFTEQLTAWLEKRPQDAALRFKLAAALAEQGQTEAAIGEYQAALALEVTAQGFIGLLELLIDSGDADRLLMVLGQIVEEADSLSDVSDAVDKLGDHNELIDRLLAEASQDRTTMEQFAAAFVAVECDRIDAVESLIESAVGSDEDADHHDILQQVGLSLLIGNHPHTAAKVFQYALDENPDDSKRAVDLYYQSGALALAEEDERALETARAAAKLNDAPLFQSRPAWILYRAGQRDEARTAYLKLIEEQGDSYESENMRETLRDARLILSNLAVQDDQLPEAEEWLEQVLDEYPEDIGALNDLGYLWADQGKHLLRSLRMVRTAVEAEPENKAYRDSLGWAYFKLGRYDEALAELLLAADDEEPDGVILDHLGDAYQKVGQLAQAIEAWKRAVAAFEKDGQEKLLEATRAKLDEPP